jgi:hypothetical protein
MKTMLTVRWQAGSPRGIEFANRLQAMAPEEAADELFDMFSLCAAEDLALQIAEDLQLKPATARRIAAEILSRRGSPPFI